MAIKSIEEAREKVLSIRNGFRVDNEFERDKFFVIVAVPNDYDLDKHGPFIGGAVKVDKATGAISVYNPLLDE